MSAEFDQLLEATIAHLETLKERGVRYVTVQSNLLLALSAAPASPTPSSSLRAIPLSPPTPSAPHRVVPPAPAAKPAVTALALGPVVLGEERVRAMAELQTRASECLLCPPLAAARQNVVFGVGDIFARLMFVGEGPGAEEDAQAEPFVGPAGQLLTRMIQAMGYTRDQVYIANIVKCRPDTPGQSSGNRKPTSTEMATCRPYLEKQIELIRPEVIVALGATAVEGLLGLSGGITRLRGQWQEYAGIPVMPTFHPAYLLRNNAPSEKRKVWEDLLAVMERLALPISEKQRTYFTSTR